MSETQGENGDGRMDQLLAEVAALRRELAAVHRLVERPAPESDDAEGAVQRAYKEFCKLPKDSSRSFRWGFLGAWDRGGGSVSTCVSVNTTDIDGFLFGHTNAEVAAFAQVFAEADTVAICKCLFQRGGRAETEQVREDCGLDGSAFEAALRPLLAWRMVEQKDDWLEGRGQGLNWAITLIGMAGEGFKSKEDKGE